MGTHPTLRDHVLATLFLERNQGWLLFAMASAWAAVQIVGDVYLQLATVRPLLVFLPVDGEMPPICGFCVLGF